MSKLARTLRDGWLIALILSASVPALGVTREWASPASGLWDAPLNWSPADAPDTASETAEFSVFGTYNVALTAGVTTQTGGLDVVRGDLTFRPTDFQDATLEVLGDASLGGEVELAAIGDAGVQLNTTGELSVASGKRLWLGGSGVRAASTKLASGTAAVQTVLELADASTGDFGDTTIGDDTGGTAASRLALVGGSTGSFDDLAIGVGHPDASAEVEVIGSTLTQDAGGVATIGQSRVLGSVGAATLGVGAGGDLSLRDATVHETGQLINAGANYSIAERLLIDGGRVEERNAATRALGASIEVTIRNGGVWSITNQPLSLGAGQTLTLDGGQLTGAAAVSLGGGLVVPSGDEGAIDNPVTLMPGGSLDVSSGGAVRFAGAFVNEGGTLNIASGGQAVFEGSYTGAGAAGQGSITFGGEMSPGMSAGAAHFDGDVAWDSASEYLVELAGVLPGESDAVSVDGAAALGGTLAVELLAGEGGGQPFAPQAGDAFTVLTATDVDGAFDTVSVPALAGLLEWRVHVTATDVTLLVVTPGVAGDFNSDGAVDAADYTLWRDALGTTGPLLAADANGDDAVTQADYDLWEAAFTGSPAAAVPEPTGGLMLALGAVTAVFPIMVARPSRRP